MHIDPMTNEDLDEALYMAVSNEELAEVRRLLEAGANPNWLDQNSLGGWGTMQCAVVGPLEILEALVEHGGSSDASLVENEDSPLHEAADSGKLPALELLLRKDFERSLNAFNDMAWTPLLAAAEARQHEAVRLLLQAGCDVNAHQEEQVGETALGQVAKDCDLRMAKLLIDAGANPLLKGWMGSSAFTRAMERQDPEGKEIFHLLHQAAARFLPRTMEDVQERDDVRLVRDLPDAGLTTSARGHFICRRDNGLLHVHFLQNREWICKDLPEHLLRPVRLEELGSRNDG